MNDAHWNGEGLPPPGTECMVTPHNTLWGFDNLDTRRVKVVARQADYEWLMELYSDGSDSLSFITTRTDKVDFTPYRTPEQIAAEERGLAAQEWLKGIEQKYGKETADKCEDILMQAEGRKQVAP